MFPKLPKLSIASMFELYSFKCPELCDIRHSTNYFVWNMDTFKERGKQFKKNSGIINLTFSSS